MVSETRKVCSDRIMAAIAIVGLMVLATPVRGEEPAPRMSLALADASDITLKKSGEVRIGLDETFIVDGRVFKVSVAFRDFEAYELAKRTVDGVLDLGTLSGAMVRDERSDLHTYVPAKSSASILDLVASAHHAICGDVVARGFVRLGDDLFAGVNLHAGVVPVEKPDRIRAKRSDEPAINDVFGDCDTFAWGGCGGPDCANLGFGSSLRLGTCQRARLHFFPDICLCGG